MLVVQLLVMYYIVIRMDMLIKHMVGICQSIYYDSP